MQTGEDVLAFGSLRLYRGSRMLLCHGVPVRLGGRAMDLLLALAGRAPNVMSIAELEAAVWPATSVDASSLRAQIATLRKTLGDAAGDGRPYIKNVPARATRWPSR